MIAAVAVAVGLLLLAVGVLLRQARHQGEMEASVESNTHLDDIQRRASHARDRLEHDNDYARRVRARFKRQFLPHL